MTAPRPHGLALHVAEDDLAACVGCGLCLPHCPTYRVTGEEAASPRGRIALMREVHLDGAPAGPDFVRFMEACVQCRGCEPACPSGVPFGRLMEGTRSALAAERLTVPAWQRVGYRALGRHRLVLALSTVAAVAQRARLVPRRAGLPGLPVRRRPLRATGSDVWFFPGCVMDAWQRPVHTAAVAVLRAAGVGVALPGPGADCCGALHVHAGLRAEAQVLAARVMAAFPGERPIVVDSAGCGAALKDYGHLLDTDAAHRFSARVVDVHEHLADRLDRLPVPPRRIAGRVAVQDPCHLRHVQRVHPAVRAVLRPVVEELVELDDEGLCCGAGGAYAVLHAEEAGAIRARKLAAIARSGAGIVASANPGCQIHLAGAGLDVRHPMELIAASLRLSP